MKNIIKKQIHSVCRFDREDFLNNNQEINDLMLRILLSHETDNEDFDIQQSKDFLHNINADILTKEFLKVRLYMLLDHKTNTPISFALFSQDKKREDWHLEYISTNKEYCGIGYAEKLFMYAAKDIATTKYPYISSVVNEDNFASLALHDAVGNQKGIKLQSAEMDDADELYDSYVDDNLDYGDYSQTNGYANRISFLFDVSELKSQAELENDDEIIL